VWSLDEAMQATKNNTWPVANVPNPISRSLRFRSSASAYLNRTPVTASNRRTFTFSSWVKRGVLGGSNFQPIFAAGTGTSYCTLGFLNTDDLYFEHRDSGVSQCLLDSTSVYRDPSGWYHIVLQVDTTQATASNRVRLYVNGTQLTAFTTATYFTQNYENLLINNTTAHYLSFLPNTNYFDGYQAEVNFIDGQALTPSSFGGTNAVTGVWEPRVYTGTYGTNGFYLNFKDNASTSTLGLDYSGNNNTWTTNNISLTAGSTYDSMLDVPTQWIGYNTGDLASVTRGNYAVMNPINKGATQTISSANLNFANSAGSDGLALSTIGVSSGKWYCEVTALGSDCMVGVTSNPVASGSYVGALSTGYGYYQTGAKYNNGSSSAYGASYTTNDVIGIALDLDAGTVVFYKNNTSQGTAFSSLSGTFFFAVGNGSVNSLGAINFGQRPFSYTPPAGFLSLCTTNLPSPTILQGDDYFNAVLWTGNGASSRAITGVGFQPDFVWTKSRSDVNPNVLIDSNRGITKYLISNTTAAEGTNATLITSLDSDGFTIGSDDLDYNNYSGATYVSWNWRASNAAAVSNVAGTITSTVSANTTAGFSIVTYTGTGANATVGHGLGVAPRMVIVKCRNQTRSWPVYHASIGNTGFVQLQATTAALFTPSLWNNTTPTSTVFSLGSDPETNGSGNTYVAYCFAAVPGYSAFGSYTGNGSTDGPFVFTGFRPRFVMIKRTETSGDGWILWDSARSPSNITSVALSADSSGAEFSYSTLDLLSNGMKVRGTAGNTAVNASGSTYIYMAFAENPFKNALAR
jgi:hypothetical protein